MVSGELRRVSDIKNAQFNELLADARLPDDLQNLTQGSGFRVQSSEFKVDGSGFWVQSLGCRVCGKEVVLK